MPFAALPSSPGFQQPPVPDWGRFAELAIQGIQHGGDLRAQASRDAMAQMDKSFEQVSKMIQYNSPEAKAERRMKMIQMQAMEQVYNDYKLHPENYIMSAHGPVQKDPFTQAMKVTQYNNAQTTGEINKRNLARGQKQDALNNDLDTFRKTYGNVNANDLPAAPTEAAPAGSPGSTSTTVAAPAPAGSGQIPVAPDTTVPIGSTGSDTDISGQPIVDVNGVPLNTQP